LISGSSDWIFFAWFKVNGVPFGMGVGDWIGIDGFNEFPVLTGDWTEFSIKVLFVVFILIFTLNLKPLIKISG
jgi:hypothetical protein